MLHEVFGFPSELPQFPDLGRQNRPHHVPVTDRTRLMPLRDLVRPVPHQDAHVVPAVQARLQDLVFGLEEHLARSALQKVLHDGVAELERGVGLDAEDDHVGKVHARDLDDLRVRRGLAEDAAGREDLVDGVDDHPGCWMG